MNKLEFLSPEHYKMFKEYAQKLRSPGEVNKKYFSALYVVSGSDRIREIMLPYIDLEEGKITTSSIIDDHSLEKTELTLIKLVIHLYNNKEWVLPTELVCLSSEDYQLAVQAITLCRNELVQSITYNN